MYLSSLDALDSEAMPDADMMVSSVADMVSATFAKKMALVIDRCFEQVADAAGPSTEQCWSFEDRRRLFCYRSGAVHERRKASVTQVEKNVYKKDIPRGSFVKCI